MERNSKHTDEARNKMSLAHIGKKLHFSDEHRRRLSEAGKGKKFTKERKLNISLSMIGRKLSDEHKKKIGARFKGKKLTPEHIKKISLGNIGKHRLSGEFASNWKGGRTGNGGGYVAIYSPDHPFANRKYVLEHRLVMEKRLGRYLKPTEIVHHIDGNKQNNLDENLVLTNRAEHAKEHYGPKNMETAFKAGQIPWNKKQR